MTSGEFARESDEGELSCDHRSVDGASGSAFLQTPKGFLEDPVRMLA